MGYLLIRTLYLDGFLQKSLKEPYLGSGAGFPQPIVRFVLFMALFLFAMADVKSLTLRDSVKKHRVKLDIVPLYSVLFDVRKQVRVGLEYQENFNKRYARGIHLDIGLYDDYTYFKYYDFFNQGDGFHYIRQDVKTYGFHLMPAMHYRLSRQKSGKKIQGFTGITVDLNMFEKKIKSFNSGTMARYWESDRQARLGIGPHVGIIWRIRKSLHIELKGIFIAKIITIRSDKAMKDIKPFKSVWFDERQRFWFIPQFSLCYDF